MTNANSFLAAAKALREEAAKPRNRKYAHAYNLSADNLEQEAAALDATVAAPVERIRCGLPVT